MWLNENFTESHKELGVFWGGILLCSCPAENAQHSNAETISQKWFDEGLYCCNKNLLLPFVQSTSSSSINALAFVLVSGRQCLWLMGLFFPPPIFQVLSSISNIIVANIDFKTKKTKWSEFRWMFSHQLNVLNQALCIIFIRDALKKALCLSPYK